MRSADVDEFWPPIPRSASIPAAARLGDGARPGLQDRRSSSQHLIIGVHARKARALPVVRQMKLAKDDEALNRAVFEDAAKVALEEMMYEKAAEDAKKWAAANQN